MERTRFNHSKLKGRIIEKFGTQKAFAQKIGMPEVTLCRRLKGDIFFTQPEILRIAIALGIEMTELDAYFFTL